MELLARLGMLFLLFWESDMRAPRGPRATPQRSILHVGLGEAVAQSGNLVCLDQLARHGSRSFRTVAHSASTAPLRPRATRPSHVDLERALLAFSMPHSRPRGACPPPPSMPRGTRLIVPTARAPPRVERARSAASQAARDGVVRVRQLALQFSTLLGQRELLRLRLHLTRSCSASNRRSSLSLATSSCGQQRARLSSFPRNSTRFCRARSAEPRMSPRRLGPRLRRREVGLSSRPVSSRGHPARSSGAPAPGRPRPSPWRVDLI